MNNELYGMNSMKKVRLQGNYGKILENHSYESKTKQKINRCIFYKEIDRIVYSIYIQYKNKYTQYII